MPATPVPGTFRCSFGGGALLLVAGLLLLAGCIADDPVPEATADPADQMDTADDTADETAEQTAEDPAASDSAESPAEVIVEADFVETTCAFVPPPGTTPRCGTVTVPEDWAAG
ncbi:MAG: hypothetical protein ACR2QO_22855, partial [Acidimicrobiales bacterium]